MSGRRGKLGDAERLQAERQRALAEIQGALKVSPMDVALWIELGDLQQETGLLDDAIRSFEQALRVDDEAVDAYYGLGTALRLNLEFERSEDVLRLGIELEPRVDALVLLGDVLVTQGKKRDAEECFRRALRMDSNDDEALIGLAIVLKKSQPEEAQELIERALQVHPSWSLAYRELGVVLCHRKQWLEAEAALEEAQKLDPADHWTYLILAIVHKQLQKLDEVEHDYLMAVEVAEHSSESWRLLGNFYSRSERLHDSIVCYRRAIEEDSENAEAARGLGLSLLENGDVKEARDWIERAAALDPWDSGLREVLVELLDGDEDSDRAPQ